jgi:molecular chaperone DnaJ
MDLYAILGLTSGATLGEIKRAYRRLARKYHPDINPGDQAAASLFRQISHAYETLRDPERRRRYDQSGEAETGADDFSFEFTGFDFSVASVEGQQASTFGDLFADVLTRPAGRSVDELERGADLHAPVTLSFEESMRGAEREVTLTRRELCRRCAGMGVLTLEETVCLQCHGTGSIRSARGHMLFLKACLACEGTGRRRKQSCSVCGGQGLEARTETIAVRIPAGVADGARVRVPSKGHRGPQRGPAGDLYIAVQVLPHPLLRREDDDLHIVMPVAIHEAALGARIDVPGVDGPIKLRVPPGTQSGQRFRLRDRGAPSLRQPGRRGDLVVEVRLMLPRVLDERSKELLREFGRINTEDVRKEQGMQSWQPSEAAKPTT